MSNHPTGNNLANEKSEKMEQTRDRLLDLLRPLSKEVARRIANPQNAANRALKNERR
jgi:hypothetical protein